MTMIKLNLLVCVLLTVGRTLKNGANDIKNNQLLEIIRQLSSVFI